MSEFDEKNDEIEQEILYPVIYDDNTKQKSKAARRRFITLSTLFIFGGFGIGAGISVGSAFVNLIGHNVPASEMQRRVSPDGLLAATLEPLSMVEAVEIVKPSVVSINTSVPRAGVNMGSRFFEVEDAQSSGTGIVFHEDEDTFFIVTNEHVIENAASINVAFGRSGEVEAVVFGRDRGSDLAVISVSKADVKAAGITEVAVARFGNSSDMQIGEVVMAIGNALGQGITTTMGVVSARDIRINIEERSLNVLQTDASINRGNSGGPLINSRGEVIGINTAKVVRDNAIGMGYSITSNAAIPIIDMILNEQTPATLGINAIPMEMVSEGHREELGIGDIDYGVVIMRVQPRSGADQAGLISADTITHFNGQRVRDMDHLRELIEAYSIGDTVTLAILREGAEQSIRVTFMQW